MALRTVIYIRKSSKDGEGKQVHSLPRQREEIMGFVEKYNYINESEERLVFDEERDMIMEDASARAPGRPKFNQMVSDIKKGKYDVLLCLEQSRLSRNAVDTGVLVQLLEEKYLKMIRMKDQAFRAVPTDMFVLQMFLSVSKLENDQRGVNTSSGIKHQRRRGATTHKAPLGYVNVGTKKGQRGVDKDPETWDGVRRLWDLMLTGDWSIADLTREAERLGVRTLRKKKRFEVSDTTLRGMFVNKYYVGFLKETDKGTKEIEWLPGNHTAMVTEDEFERVQLLLQQRGYKHQKPAHGPSIESLLNELLVCGKCKREVNGMMGPTKMVFEQKIRYTCAACGHRYTSAIEKPCPECGADVQKNTKIDRHRYYRCGQRHSSDACAHDFYGTGAKKNIKAEDIEQYLDKHLSKLHISDELFHVLKRQLYTLWLKKNDAIVARRKVLEKEKKGLEKKRLKYRKKLLEEEENLSDTAKEDIEQLIDDAIIEEQDISIKIGDLQEEESEKFERAWQALQALREAKSVFNEPSIEHEPKRRLLLSMVSNLVITDQKWEIKWKKPFDVVAKATIAKRGRPKSKSTSDDDNLDWLPGSDSNRRPIR